MRPLLLALLVAMGSAATARGNDVELALSPSVPVGKKPALTIKVNKDLASAEVDIKSTAGKVRQTFGAKSAGSDIVVVLPHTAPGKAQWRGSLDVTFADDTKGSMPLSFATEVLAGFKFHVKDEDVNLTEHSLVVVSEHDTARVELEVYGDEGEQLANTAQDFPNVKAGTPIKVEWSPKKPGDALRIHVVVHDSKTAFQSTDLFPYTMSIPHEEVEFETGKHDVRASEEPKLVAALAEIQKAVKRFADALKADDAVVRLKVVGHTDTVGSAASNRALSQRRAQSIARWFAQKGVRAPIYAHGAGEDDLKVQTPDETDEQKNRRVDYDVEAGPKGQAQPGWQRIN